MAKKKKMKFRGKVLFVVIIMFLLLFYKNKIKEFLVDNNIVSEKVYDIIDTSESDPEVLEKVFATGMSVEDIKSLYDQKENYIKSTHDYSKVEYDFEEKLHYSDIEEILEELNNSDVVKLENIGTSVDGRTIYGVEVGTGDNVFLIDGNTHAAEIANTLILIKFLTDVVNDYESGGESTIKLLKSVKIAAIVCMNPDGYEVYNFGVESLNNKNLWWYQNKDDIDFNYIKSNANGIDLNRNFPTQNAGTYFKGKDLISVVSLEKTTSRSTYFGGTTLGSEPETRATMYFMLKHYKNTYAYINMHTQGRIIYAGCPNLSDEFNTLSRDFARQIILNAPSYSLKEIEAEEVGEGNDGGAADFMAELANGFKFSSVTGKLSSSSYVNNNSTLVYKYPAITLETGDDWYKNPAYFKDEYYNYGIKSVLYDIINSY